MNCVLFLALIAYLSWASLGRERVMTSQLFCLSLAFLETYKAGVGTPHTTQTEQDNSEESNPRCYTSTLPKARSAAPTFFCRKTHKTIRMIMVERETIGGAQHPPPNKKKRDLHGCLQYFAAQSRAVTRL
ncbi:hypothetical protein B0I37DRAFT_71139 [Chaetomium sp. MPI-CAGE-AT-0009]|nr:hypothetical protein B0I37DRAFT_71139 [Chaetomium sp. MPI-CAGE-AT-0009]